MRRARLVHTLEGARCSVEPAPRGDLVRLRVNTAAGELSLWMSADHLVTLAEVLEQTADEVRA